MKHTKNAIAAIVGLSTVFFYACQKEANMPDRQLSKLTVFLTDHVTPVFDSVFIDIQKLEVKLEDDSLFDEGWFTVNIRPGVYNILRLRNGLDTLFGTATLPNNRLRKIRLTLGSQNSVMKNGQSFPLRVNENDSQVVVNIDDSNFQIVGNDQVKFWIDFDAGSSIQVDNSGPGNNNGFILKSHIKIFTHSNTGSIEGKVLPGDAEAIVSATNNMCTFFAIPDDDDGEFKIVGLGAGTYTVFIDGNNGYADTTINNVIVRIGEDTHLSSVTLKR